MSGILVVLEQRAHKSLARINWEALTAALRLGPPASVAAVILGADTQAAAAEIAAKAPSRVISVQHPLLTPYTADGTLAALQQLIQFENPDFVVFPHTYQVRDYAPALATRFGQVLLSDVTAIAETAVGTATFRSQR